MVEEVVILALESGMWLLFNFENDVAGLNSGCLVSLAPEVNLVSTPHTSVDVDVEDLSLNNGLLAVADLALVLLAYYLSFSVAVGAERVQCASQ